MTDAEDFSPERLRTLRWERGITQSRLASLCGVSVWTIGRWETGRVTPAASAWSRVLKRLSSAESVPDIPPRVRPTEAVFTLEPGHRYTIRSSAKDGYGACIHVDKMSVFEYVSKKGIHHYFKEARGGWSRTFTDAQLVGKIIREVAG